MKNYTTIAMDLQSIPASDFHIPYPLANSTTIDDPVPDKVDTVPDLTPLVFLQLLYILKACIGRTIEITIIIESCYVNLKIKNSSDNHQKFIHCIPNCTDSPTVLCSFCYY